MFDAGLLDIEAALVADEKLGFGNIDGDQDALTDADLTPLERGLIAAGAEQDYSDLPSEEILSFLLDAARLEDTYKKFLKDLDASGTKLIRYTGQPMGALEQRFADIGLKVLGPSRPHLDRCARATAKAVKANAKRPPRKDGFALDSVDAVARYREMFDQRAVADLAGDALLADFVRDGKNNTSIVLKIAVAGKCALLAGDMQFADAMIAGMEQDMRNIRDAVRDAGPYDVIKTSHHTSFNGLNEDVMDDYGDTALFVHSGGRRDPDHPDAEALSVLKAAKNRIRFARTDRNGLITVNLAPGEPTLELSQGKVNAFTLNPRNVPDVLAVPTVPAAVRAASASIARERVETLTETVEVITRIPHRQTKVTVTVQVDPAVAIASAISDLPYAPQRTVPQQPVSGSGFALAAGRNLPKLLFVTQPDQLAANIGREESREVLAVLSAHDVVELRPGSSDPNDAIAQVRASLPGTYEGVVLLGGYDVVPPRRLDSIGDAIRAKLESDPEMGEDPDDFVVWSDEGFVDLNEDGRPEIPISRIPDGMSARLVRAALSAGAAAGSDKFGIRNFARPFADAVWPLIPGTSRFGVSHPLRAC